MASLPHVVVYAREGCSPCMATERFLRELSSRHRFVLSVVDVDVDATRAKEFGDRVPVVLVDGAEVMAERFVPSMLEDAIEAAVEKGDQTRK